MTSFKEIVSALEAEDVSEQTIGQRLRILRHAHGMSQTDLAEVAGITKGALSQWELGNTKNVSAGPYLKICIRLGLDPYYLWFGSKMPGKAKDSSDSYSWLDNQ